MFETRILSLISFITLLLCGCRTPQLVEVNRVIPNVVLDIRYATTNNFTGQQLYPSARCFLRPAPAEKLRAVQADLARQGLGLKIYDGYRPLSVQKRMWEVYPHEGYVANPAKGSRHNRGAAVDLTLVSLTNRMELTMPTPFDDFTPRAHRRAQDLPAEAKQNRDLLEAVMLRHGFVGLPTEWWHFDDREWRKYEILDVPVPAGK